MEGKDCIEGENFTLTIEWESIIDRYYQMYDKIYLSSSTKAYFDYCGFIIDGVKQRWRAILMLDTLISIINGIESKNIISDRRKFDQYGALRDCVVDVCSAEYVAAQMKTGVFSKLSNSCNISISTSEWKSFECMKKVLLRDKTTKSFKRREAAVDILCEGRELELERIITIVVNKIYSECFLFYFDNNRLSKYYDPATSNKLKLFCDSVEYFC